MMDMTVSRFSPLLTVSGAGLGQERGSSKENLP
jgi:hypothetical protein